MRQPAAKPFKRRHLIRGNWTALEFRTWVGRPANAPTSSRADCENPDGTVMNQPVRNLKEQARPLAEPLQNPKGRSRRRFAVISALALLVFAGVFWWSRQEIAPRPAGGGRNAGAMSIVPEVVGKGDIGINLNALGTVASLATVTIRTQISGYLTRIDFKEGQDIKKGSPKSTRGRLKRH